MKNTHTLKRGSQKTLAYTVAFVVCFTSFVVADTSHADGENLILNPSMEEADPTDATQPLHWAAGQWGDLDANFLYPVDGPNGDKAAHVQITRYADGDAKWYFQDVTVTPGSTYTFSDQYKSTIPTTVTVQYTDAGGNLSYADVIPSLPVSPEWSTATQMITVPVWVTKLTIFHLINAVWTLDIDNASLIASWSEWGDNLFPTGMVSLTFDDNWNSQSTVLPLLTAAGIKATFYIVTNVVADVMFSQSQIRGIYDAGQEIGAHTRTHPFLTTLPVEEMTTEIVGSRQDLIGSGMPPADTFAYPYGEYNDAVVQATKDAGFIGARWVEDGYNTKDTNRYDLMVQNIENTTTLDQLKSWVQTAMSERTWLILVFHQVDNQNNQYGITPDNFKTLIDYMSANKIPTVTTRQGLNMMN